MTPLARLGNFLRRVSALQIPQRTVMKVKDEDFWLEFLEGEHDGVLFLLFFYILYGLYMESHI